VSAGSKASPAGVRRLETRLEGLVLIEPLVHRDERGFFQETYRRDAYAEIGVDADFVQDNHSRSQRGTLRAFHFQLSPGQAKLVRAARGSVYDVVVDLRRDSPTFGRHEAFELSDDNGRQLFVPIGFAHGFCVTSDVADVTYKVSSYYDASTERGIAYDDPHLDVRWPVEQPIVSERDRNNPRLTEIADELPW
jgi:dTDP-4-dehydrorhamnose 3,5-epimerase